MRLEVEPVRVRLRAPFTAAWGEIAERELVLVRIQDAHGGEGIGEASPLPGYREATVVDVVAALERCRGILWDGDACGRPELLAACASAAELPEALVAIDLALWDLEGRRCGLPVWRLLSREGPWDITRKYSELSPKLTSTAAVAVNATVVAAEPAAAAAEASRARDAGFGCVKVKVGVGGDLERVSAVRAAVGPGVRLRIDANGAWSEEEAVAALHALAPLAIELCEEPVHGLDAIGRVAAASPVPVALDETASAPGALRRRVCTAVCLKLARCGGISRLLAHAREARAVGYRVYLASTLDGPLGIAAALHAASAVRPDLACGLATLGLFANEPGTLAVRDGRMGPPPGPGLGDGLLDWYG